MILRPFKKIRELEKRLDYLEYRYENEVGLDVPILKPEYAEASGVYDPSLAISIKKLLTMLFKYLSIEVVNDEVVPPPPPKPKEMVIRKTTDKRKK